MSDQSNWVTFSFKCHVEQDKDLIELLSKVRANRSVFVRQKLRLGLRLPEPVQADVLSPELLRAELDRAVETILSTLTEGNYTPAEQMPRQFIDVNDSGKRIPDF